MSSEYEFGQKAERLRIVRILTQLAKDAKRNNYTATASKYEALISVIESEIDIITISESERRTILNAHK